MRTRGGGEEVRIGELLKGMREQRHLRQVELAKRLHRPQSYVSKYERAEHTLSLPEIEAICQALGFTIRQFLHRYESGSSKSEPHDVEPDMW